MTIKQVMLSAIAATMVTTVAFAAATSNPNKGVININGGSAPRTISKELVSIQDTNVSVGKISYIPHGIPAGTLKNPIFKFTFNNKIVSLGDNIGVYEENTSDINESTLVATNPTLSSEGKVLTFTAASADTYVTNGKTYYLGNDSNESKSTVDANITVAQSTSPSDVTVAAALYSGDSQDLADSAPAKVILQPETEYSASVTQPFNARIDASSSFTKFYDNYDKDNKSDELQIKITDKALTYNLSPNYANITVYYDTNLSKVKATVTDSYSNGKAVNLNLPVGSASYSANTPLITTDLNGTNTYDAILTTNAVLNESTINKTNFTAKVGLMKGNHYFPLLSKNTSAGQWSIYGYNAQIPNVSTASNGTRTIMKFTNTTGKKVNIYFLLRDQAGDTVTLDSVQNPSLAAIPAGSTSKYTAKELVNLIPAGKPFNKLSSFSVEVSIPTTPSKVYGEAMFIGNTGQITTLPIYNNSSLNY